MVDPVIYVNALEKSQDGAAVVEELTRLFYDRPSYRKGDDGMTAAYGEGQRSVVAFILQKLGSIQDA